MLLFCVKKIPVVWNREISDLLIRKFCLKNFEPTSGNADNDQNVLHVTEELSYRKRTIVIWKLTYTILFNGIMLCPVTGRNRPIFLPSPASQVDKLINLVENERVVLL